MFAGTFRDSISPRHPKLPCLYLEVRKPVTGLCQSNIMNLLVLQVPLDPYPTLSHLCSSVNALLGAEQDKRVEIFRKYHYQPLIFTVTREGG